MIGLGGGLLGIALAALGLFGVRQLYENYDALTRLDFTMVLIALGIAIAVGSARRPVSDLARLPACSRRAISENAGLNAVNESPSSWNFVPS